MLGVQKLLFASRHASSRHALENTGRGLEVAPTLQTIEEDRYVGSRNHLKVPAPTVINIGDLEAFLDIHEANDRSTRHQGKKLYCPPAGIDGWRSLFPENTEEHEEELPRRRH